MMTTDTTHSVFQIDRQQFRVFSSHQEAEQADRQYWLARTPQERLQQLEVLRRLNYGTQATARLQRFFRVIEPIRG